MPPDLSLLSQPLQEFAALRPFEPLEEALRFHEVSGAIHRLCQALQKLEQQGASRQDLLAQLSAVRKQHAQSPLLKRCQEWPRGYQGDFETIEWLCDGKNQAPYGTVGYLIENHILNCQASQQHRNKIRRQGDLIAQTFRQHQEDPARPPRVLCIASGGSRDVLLVMDELLRLRGELVLVDIDGGAVALAGDRLKAFGSRCQVFKGNIFRLIRKLPGRFDLILAGGLFDYLDDKHVAHLLRNCVEHLLAPGGTIFFTNMATGNPYRVWMEYLADWRLSERSEEGVRRFLLQTGFSESSLEFSRELTGLTLFVTLRAPVLGPPLSALPKTGDLPCPECLGFEMVVQQVRGVTLDLCPICGGTWLDHGELELLQGRDAAPPAPLSKTRPGKRACPRGHGPMNLGHHAKVPAVELDECPACNGLWFDRGELAQVLDAFCQPGDLPEISN